MSKKFQLVSSFKPSGDQPEAISLLKDGLKKGLTHQILLGVTGSGKTFTIASVIADLNKPTIILAPNKTLATQIYGEMKSFFPFNAIEFFVSYYDYYQPEAYLPNSDTFIEKITSVNKYIEQMRLLATKAILERRDVIIISSVSAIYGLGDPKEYSRMILHLKLGMKISQRSIINRLIKIKYVRNDKLLYVGTFRTYDEIIDIFSIDSNDNALRIEIFDDKIKKLLLFNPFNGCIYRSTLQYNIYPRTHYIFSKNKLIEAIEQIKIELDDQCRKLLNKGKYLEEKRLFKRTMLDIEIMTELGYCSGIENYSRYFFNRKAGDPPITILNYLPNDSLLVIDESHITIPQILGMYRSDRSRKRTLIEYGFRLPSALDNRPMNFKEFISSMHQIIYVSATPGNYEKRISCNKIVNQLIRPTGVLDPVIEIRPNKTQIDDLISEIRYRSKINERTLVLTLTKRMAEDLAIFLEEIGEKVCYIHSSIDVIERAEIIRNFRLGKFDVLIGVNLLREGLDIPEISLVAILDADKEGFLRSKSSLIQIIGRAARNINGKAILYADKITYSMNNAIKETMYRRKKQYDYNLINGITPQSLNKDVIDITKLNRFNVKNDKYKLKNLNIKFDKLNSDTLSLKSLDQKIKEIKISIKECVKNLEFEKAAFLRDQILFYNKIRFGKQ